MPDINNVHCFRCHFYPVVVFVYAFVLIFNAVTCYNRNQVGTWPIFYFESKGFIAQKKHKRL